MKRILSIDGGGIKGVFPAAFLADLETEVDQPIVDYFDLITGTSTGGIIAIALGLGIPAADILRFYEEKGPEIFRGGKGAIALARHFFSGKYNSAPLQDALKDVFGERRIGESQTRLMIPSLDLETGQVHVIKTAHHPRFERDYKMSALDAAMATAAAPTYFPTHRLSTGIPLVDGGMWANNPMGPGAVEAMGILEWTKGEVKLLSIGCTEAPLNVDADRAKRLGVTYWASRIVTVFMAGQSSSSLGTAQLLLGHENVVRVSPVVDRKRFKLDGVKGIPALRGLGASQSRIELPKLRPIFFNEPAETFAPIRTLDGEGAAA